METTQIKPTEDWRGLTIYQVMVSSFIHDPSGAIGYDDLWGPSGETKNGNLKGVIDALEVRNPRHRGISPTTISRSTPISALRMTCASLWRKPTTVAFT